MGNCCKGGLSSAAEHDDDEWAQLPLSQSHKSTVLFDAASNSDKNRLLPVSSTSSSARDQQVKIKVSKRELEELISRIEKQGLSSQQILARLILSGGGDQFRGLFGQVDEDDRRCWKPVLQSIPEVNCASDSFDCC